MSIVRDKKIISEQCKSARALLNWSQDDLATFSGVGKSTIADFERKNRDLLDRTMSDIISAFQDHGITFEIGENYLVVRLDHLKK